MFHLYLHEHICIYLLFEEEKIKLNKFYILEVVFNFCMESHNLRQTKLILVVFL